MNRQCAFALTCTVGLFSHCHSVSANERSAAALDAYLASCAASYSSEHAMLGMPFESPGYHSQVPQGTWVHPTRRSLDYAVLLVARGQPDDLTRAAAIIRKVLSLQVIEKDNAYYGIWPWLLEEPVDHMAPPDRNWADFLGAQIAVLLKKYDDRLPETLSDAMRQSLYHAAVEIRQRDVQPSYTNIAIMGGGVCAATGELLQDPAQLYYGRDRLQRCVSHAKHHGSFNEYNSPTYTCVALFEAERVLDLVQDEESRQAAESLRRMAWTIVADSFHPATGQWAGPHSRTYEDFMSANTADFLQQQTGVEIHAVTAAEEPTPSVQSFQHIRCPQDLLPRFRALPSDPFELRRTFIRKESGEPATIGTTWFTADACLGSVNRSMLWTQRRTLLAYWSIDPQQVACLRQRFLHDDQDFASMGVCNAQDGPRVLSLFEPLRNHGSWHPTLDRPQDGVFTAKDLRVRYELAGPGATARRMGPHLFELRSGDRRVIVHVLPGHFAGQDVRWEWSSQDGAAFVDGICYAGAARDFNFAKLEDVTLVTAIELLEADETPQAGPELANGDFSSLEASWNINGMTLHVHR